MSKYENRGTRGAGLATSFEAIATLTLKQRGLRGTRPDVDRHLGVKQGTTQSLVNKYRFPSSDAVLDLVELWNEAENVFTDVFTGVFMGVRERDGAWEVYKLPV